MELTSIGRYSVVLPRKQIDLFRLFLEENFGANVCTRNAQEIERLGEHLRTVLGDKLIVVREITNSKAEAVEVFCSDLVLLKNLEDTWNLTLMAVAKENDDGGTRIEESAQ